MKIDISSKLVLLAAGGQERFGPGLPKCLHKVNGELILARLVRRFDMGRPIIVAPVWWEQAYVRTAKSLGDVFIVPAGLTIGHSVSTGLQHCGGARIGLVVSADTVIPNYTKICIPRGLEWALFDPWEYITLQILGSGVDTQRRYKKHCEGRVEYLAQVRTPVDLFISGWVNMNTQDDLERAQRLCQKE